MPKEKKRSFFERLTGSISMDNEEENEDEVGTKKIKVKSSGEKESPKNKNGWVEEENDEGELPIDMYQTPTEIIVRTMVAGVKPEDLTVSITRDMVTIKGKREEQYETTGDDSYTKELYWGAFSRTILLPQEVEAEEAEAVEKHGLLTIKLPKLNKEKVQTLRIKSL